MTTLIEGASPLPRLARLVLTQAGGLTQVGGPMIWSSTSRPRNCLIFDMDLVRSIGVQVVSARIDTDRIMCASRPSAGSCAARAGERAFA